MNPSEKLFNLGFYKPLLCSCYAHSTRQEIMEGRAPAPTRCPQHELSAIEGHEDPTPGHGQHSGSPVRWSHLAHCQEGLWWLVQTMSLVCPQALAQGPVQQRCF